MYFRKLIRKFLEKKLPSTNSTKKLEINERVEFSKIWFYSGLTSEGGKVHCHLGKAFN